MRPAPSHRPRRWTAALTGRRPVALTVRRTAALTVLLLAVLAGPAGARAASPSRGDWESTGASSLTHASFAVSTAGRGAKAHAVVQDLTIQAPIGCTDSPQPALPIDVRVISGALKLSPSGVFKAGSIKHGSGTAVSGRFHAGRFAITYRHVSRTKNAYDGGTEVCDTKTIHLKASRGHRRAIKDGVWRGQDAAQEPVVFNVAAGGRALQAPARPSSDGSQPTAFAFGQFTQTCFTGGCTPSSNDICAYESTSTLFVAASGAFGNAELQRGDDASVAGQFTSGNRASGTFANGPEGCPPSGWSARPG